LIDVIYDGWNLPFLSNSFDTIVSFEVFEHVFNPEQILSEIYRVLKPGGHILITTPFCWGEHEQPYDFIRYTSFGMESILERNEFKVLSITKTNDSFLAIPQMLISYISNHVLPKGKILSIVLQLSVVFPLT
jgi:SAM-dependent methyltransferase